MTSKRAAAPCEPVLGEPGKGGLGYLALFELGHGQLRRAKSHGSAGFHLDKYKSLAILRNDIDFSGLAAEVPFDNVEPLPLKMCSSDCLAPLAKGLVICAVVLSTISCSIAIRRRSRTSPLSRVP